MFRKTLIAHFFTTINSQIFLNTLKILWNSLFWFHLKDWKYIYNTEKKLWDILGLKESKVISFYNARSAIYNLLQWLNIKKDDEIIIQAYTCVSVPNAIIQSGAIPIYADIDIKTLNFDLESLENKITKKTKAIMVQHTFWNPIDIHVVKKLCVKNDLLLIEDCAHALWSEIDGKKVWSFWDFSIFSTGRDKVISSVTGGYLIINNKEYFKISDKIETQLTHVSIITILRNLNYNILWYMAYKLYDILWIGKILIFLSSKLKLITKILTPEEKNCNFTQLHYKLPNALAYLWWKELDLLDKYNQHRIFLAEYYQKKISDIKEIRFIKTWKKSLNNHYGCVIIVVDAVWLQKYCKKNKILLWDYWNGWAIIPNGTNIQAAWYRAWSCLNAEKISKKVFTLPNHAEISLNDAKRIVKTIKKYYI